MKHIKKRMMDWRFAAAVVAGLVTAAGAQVTPTVRASYRLATMPAEGQAGAGQDSPNAPVKDDLFAGTKVFEKNASDVQEITMDPSTLDMVGGNDRHKARNMVLDVVRTYTYDKPGMYNMADVDVFRNKLNSGDWHCSVHVRDLKTGTSTDVCEKHRTDGLRETAIITVEPKSLTFIHTIKRAPGPGSSDLTVLPFLSGMGPMPMMAMIDPEAFMDMQMAMDDMPGMKLQMEEQLKQHAPEMQKQMEEMKKQLKEAQKNFKFDQRQFNLDGATPKDGQPKQPE